MFARILRAALKSGQGEAYARTLEKDIVPILQKFAGFRDELAMVSVDGKEVVAISFWRKQEDAEEYNRAAYADVLKKAEGLLDGTPEIRNYNVVVSTVHAGIAT